MDETLPSNAFMGRELAVFVVDERRRVLFINEAASLLLAKNPHLVEGSPCWEVIGLRTLDGKPFCGQECQPWQHARDGKPDKRFHLTYRSPAGSVSEIHLWPSLLSAPGQGPAALLHVIQPAYPSIDLPMSEPDTATARDCPELQSGHLRNTLTGRETEVLQLLAGGHSTADISNRLGISPVTVRNHLQNVMKKLDVHRRLDAVVAWMTGRA